MCKLLFLLYLKSRKTPRYPLWIILTIRFQHIPSPKEILSEESGIKAFRKNIVGVVAVNISSKSKNLFGLGSIYSFLQKEQTVLISVKNVSGLGDYLG